MKVAAGTRVGPYEIVSAIGAGGMGQVYRARDTRLQRDVAIKILPASFAGDPDRRARFEREARAVAALSHPNVLAIFDTGIHDGEMFVVTELLEGETLAERLKSGALPVRKALDIAVQIARGLAAAHDKHIVHRDLKPENLFLLADGRVKILDFGLARYSPSDSGASETVPAVSDPGVAMGTVGYMAPEQVRGQAVDGRADLFALGAVLYEMFTGQRAFRRETAAETMTAILRDDPPERPLAQAQLSPALDRIVRHALEKNPSERFHSARDVGFAIEALSGSGTAPSAPAMDDRVARSAGGSRRGAVTVSIAAAVIAAGALIWWLMTRGPGDAPGSLLTIGSATQVTAQDGLEIDPVLSPDGRLMAYSSGSAGEMRIFIRPITGERTLPLSEGRASLEYQPRFSPDGNQILFLTATGASVASSFGGSARPIASGSIRSAAWAPDGKRVVLAREDHISVSTIDGSGGEKMLTRAYEPHSCAWAPTDRWVACVSGNRFATRPGTRLFGNIAPSALVLVPPSGGASVEVTAGTSMNLSPVWSADGRHLYFISNRNGPTDIYAVEIREDGRPAAEPVRVTTGLGVQAIALSADGRRLVYATYRARANVWKLPIPARGPVDTSGAVAVTTENQLIEAMSISRDGKWLLFDSDRFGSSDIFRVPLTGGGPSTQLTTDPAGDFAPEVSPDGRMLAFHAFRSGSRDIFIQPFDGGAAQAVTSTPLQESYPAWSPDSQALAFFDQAGEDGGSRGLFVIRRDASGQWGAPIGLRRGIGSKPQWLPGGQSIAIITGGTIEIVDVESRAVRVVYRPSGPDAPEAESVGVSDDGRVIYFKSHDAQHRASFWSVPAAGGAPTLLVRFTDPARESARRDFAVGAGHFFFTLEDRQADIWIADVVPSRK